MAIFLLIILGSNFEPTSLGELKGNWTIKLGMREWVPSNFSLLWRPIKSIMIGISGQIYIEQHIGNSKYKRLDCTLGLPFYKYFLSDKPILFYINLIPSISRQYYYEERLAFGVNFNYGFEYFFKFYKKQLSASINIKLSCLSYEYIDIYGYYNYRRLSCIIYLPTEVPLSTYLSIHF